MDVEAEEEEESPTEKDQLEEAHSAWCKLDENGKREEKDDGCCHKCWNLWQIFELVQVSCNLNWYTASAQSGSDYVDQLISEVVESPTVRGPIFVNESALKREESSQNDRNLLYSSSNNEGQEGDKKRSKRNCGYLNQPRRSFSCVILFEDVLLENVCKKSQRSIEVDMFEIQETGISEGSSEELSPLDEMHCQ